MDELDELFFFFLEPNIKVIVVEQWKTEHVNQIFVSRDEKGDFKMLFQELCDQPERFFFYILG